MLQFMKHPHTEGDISLFGGVSVYTNVKKDIQNIPKILQSIKDVKKNYEYSSSMIWNCNVRTSFFNSLEQNQKLKKNILPLQENLKEDINAYLEFFDFDNDNYEWQYGDTWANKYKNNEFQEKHNHVGDKGVQTDEELTVNQAISLIFYPEECDSHILTFHTEIPNLNNFWHLPIKNYTLFNTFKSAGISAEKNMVIIFPSFLDHSVRFFKESNRERFSISMNIEINKKNEKL